MLDVVVVLVATHSVNDPSTKLSIIAWSVATEATHPFWSDIYGSITHSKDPSSLPLPWNTV